MSMKQKLDEYLKTYVARFTMERLLVPNCNESMPMCALSHGIRDRKLVALYESS